MGNGRAVERSPDVREQTVPVARKREAIVMRKAEEVARKLNELIDSSRYPHNSRLPPERDLAHELGVSRKLLRQALGHLEAEGRIWRHVGQGTFVGAKPVQSIRDVKVLSGLTNPAEVMEVRRTIEPECARLAALRAISSEIDKLKMYLKRSEAVTDYWTYGKWDGTLHRGIAEASHNTLLLTVFDAVNQVRLQTAWAQMWEQAIINGGLHMYHEQHRGIVDAIEKRDASGAERRMREHLDMVNRYIHTGEFEESGNGRAGVE